MVHAHSIDLVHAHLPTMGVLARLVSPVPVVYTEHNLSHSYRAPTRIASKLTYRRNRAVIAVSQAVADEVQGWPGPRPIVIPNGVSCSVSSEEIDSALTELDLDDRTHLVTHVGNIRPGKGHDVLIETARILRERRHDVTFVSIGTEKSPGDLDRVRSRAAEAELGSSLRFLGRRSDALSFVAAADVFVNPSEIEGLPVAVLEAMALERPVVATAAGGVPTIIRDGKTGFLVPPGEPESLAEGIERALGDRDLAAHMAANARKLVEEEYGLEPMVRATEDVYRNVLDG
jgi:glycosyltransferase involved in cell wall biosynthesis